jgi:16S rRNA C1402 (ribose-2'-O) methylase RsmI
VIARELTKLHETLYRGTVAELNETLKNETLKGEMVLLLHS